MKNSTEQTQQNFDVIIQNALSGKTDSGRVPIFDPANFEIFKPSANGVEISGFYLGRWSEYKQFYNLDQKLKGNGYMIAGIDGVMYLLPDWKSLENKMKAVEVATNIIVAIVDVVLNDNGESYIKTAVFKA